MTSVALDFTYNSTLHYTAVKGYFSRQVSKSAEDSSSSIERLEFLLNEALDEDEDDDAESALALYTEAVETGLKIVSESINIFCKLKQQHF